MIRRTVVGRAAALLCFTLSTAGAQHQPTIKQWLTPGYPQELAAAKTVDKLAWQGYEEGKRDRKSTRLNSSHIPLSRMPSSA